MSYCNYFELVHILEESFDFQELIGPDKNANSQHTKFKNNKPLGFIIYDSYNNPYFPINPIPKTDTAKFDTPDIIRKYKSTYSKNMDNIILLPWHFTVELVNYEYIVLNTRPIDMMFPLTIIDEKLKVDISQYIHICIVGDSTSDIYTKKIYEIITRICILPIVRLLKVPALLNNTILDINLGQNFEIRNISKFLKK